MNEQLAETLASLRDHYLSAISAGDEDRAMDVANAYRRITDRLISEDLPEAAVRTYQHLRSTGKSHRFASRIASQRAQSYQAYYRQRWQELRDMPDSDLIPVHR